MPYRGYTGYYGSAQYLDSSTSIYISTLSGIMGFYSSAT